MFRKFLIFAMFATAAGYCFAEQAMPQVTTSEVFDDQYKTSTETVDETVTVTQEDYANIPAWPLAGSDADVVVKCDDANKKKTQGNSIRIVSKIGDDMIVDNGFDFNGNGWSGGANMLHGTSIPMGFDDECENGAEMPLLRRETLEDDGGKVLAVSRSGRKHCAKRNKQQYGFIMNDGTDAANANGADASWEMEFNKDMDKETATAGADKTDAEAPAAKADEVRSWVVANGQTLREVLQDWCDKEGWDLVWATSREYPIEASAVFKGRFTDVASALVRNFGRATPVPYAKFYKGNLVLVISTNEE
ncbi:MAG: toxin co-regulated pilus biosynthesis Q family protein [Alphaproteobacteria bacterium]|nr:toxin co-regulated pilus biosynthesis Q family protein [Alphaproteobacteria bacterium]